MFSSSQMFVAILMLHAMDPSSLLEVGVLHVYVLKIHVQEVHTCNK